MKLTLLTALTYVGTMLWPATVAAELPEHTGRLASVRAWLEDGLKEDGLGAV